MDLRLIIIFALSNDLRPVHDSDICHHPSSRRSRKWWDRPLAVLLWEVRQNFRLSLVVHLMSLIELVLIMAIPSFSIHSNKQTRFVAHVVVSYVLTAYVIWLLRRELSRFVQLRHQFLLSKSHSTLAQAKTVLVTSLPEKDLTTEADLRTFASFVPGGVARVWIYRDAPGLNDAYQKRLDACGKLEGAVSSLLRDANKAWRKKQQREKATEKAKTKVQDMELKPQNGNTPAVNGNGAHTRPTSTALSDVDLESHKASSPLSILDTISRPTHHLGYVPWTGEKVDTIEWCKKEIPRLTEEIKLARVDLPNAKPHGAAMIMCNLQMGAHVLAQCASYHEVCLPCLMSIMISFLGFLPFLFKAIKDG